MTTPQDQCGFSFSTDQASKIFPGCSVDALMLAFLAGIPPQLGWEGCLVFRTASQGGQVQVGLRGPAAAAIRDCLIDSSARVGLNVLLCQEADELAMEAPIARVKDMAWC